MTRIRSVGGFPSMVPWVLGLLLVSLLHGCKSDPEEQAVALMEQLAAVSVTHAGNCEAMGKALESLLDANRGKITDLKTLRQGKTVAETGELETKYGPRRLAAATKMARAALPCAEHPAVIKALRNM